MKKIIFILSLLVVGSSLFSWDYLKELNGHYTNQKFQSAFKTIQRWEKWEPDNPEMHIAYFNYYLFWKGKEFESRTGTHRPNEKYVLSPEERQIAFSHLRKALELRPRRLDIHFGLCSALIKAKSYSEAGDAILALLDASAEEKEWFWEEQSLKDRTPIEITDEILNAVGKYLRSFYDDLESNKALLKKITEREIELYSNHLLPYHHLSGVYGTLDDYETALKWLFKAYDIDPTDIPTVNNIGLLYEWMKDFSKAQQWYESLSQSKSWEVRRLGEKSLKRLQSKE